MVWIINLIILSFFLFFFANIFSNELNKDEQMYFNFIDLNNDNKISLSEIDQSINIVFQIIDFNEDGFISKSEIVELKNIIDSLQ